MKVRLNDIHLNYETLGQGPPLVLISGYTCNINSLLLIRKELAKRFTLLLFDNRGSGESDTPDIPYSIQQMADDAMALIEHLGLKNPHILGQSMGSAIAQAMGFKHGSKLGKIVLANTFIHINRINAITLQFLYDLRIKGLPIPMLAEGFMPWLFSNDFLKKEENIQAFVKAIVEDPHPQSLLGQKRQLEALLQFDSSKWLDKIKNETLIIYGSEDILCPPADNIKMSKTIPHAKAHCIFNMGHVPHIESPGDFVKTVVEFL